MKKNTRKNKAKKANPMWTKEHFWDFISNRRVFTVIDHNGSLLGWLKLDEQHYDEICNYNQTTIAVRSILYIMDPKRVGRIKHWYQNFAITFCLIEIEDRRRGHFMTTLTCDQGDEVHLLYDFVPYIEIFGEEDAANKL